MSFRPALNTLFALSLCLLTACTNDSELKTLKLNLGGEPTLINPILSTDVSSSSVEGFIFSGLMKVDTNLEMVPDLAEKVDISPDGKRYIFHLKRNVLWHDNNPFTAKDVKFTFDTLMNPKTNTVRRSSYSINGSPIQFNVIDNYTIEARLPQPYAPFLIHMGMGILPKHLLDGEDINTTPFNRNPVGTGPFKFQAWSSGHHIILTKNQNYFGNKPKLDRILMKIIPDERTAILSLKKGEIDTASIPKKDFESFKKDDAFNIFKYEDLLYTYLGFNLDHPLFKDKRIRQAIAYSINKEAIINGVLKKYGEAAHIPASPISWAYPTNKTFPRYTYNPDKSLSILKEVGFTHNSKTGLLERNGSPLTFTLITNKGNKDREKTAQIIQQFLKQVGIQMNIQLMEWSAFLKIVNDYNTPKKFDAVLLGWSLGLDPDGYNIWHSSQYPKGFNFVGYNNPTVDSLLEKGRSEILQSKRKAIYEKVYTQIANDVPYIFLYYPEVLSGFNKRIKGLSKPGPAGLLNPIENIYISN